MGLESAIELGISVSVDSPHWRYEANDDPRDAKRDETRSRESMSAYTRKKRSSCDREGNSMYRASGTVKVAWRSSFDARGVELDSLMAFEWAMSGEVTCRLLSFCLPVCLLA